MKKIIVVLFLLLVTGCSGNDVLVEVSFNSDNYNVSRPYKAPISRSFTIDNALNNYDPNIIENDLVMLSTNYFKPNNSLFENGQYYSEEKIMELLSLNSLNNLDQNIYFTAIHEQNYLAKNGNLKGISIALVVNPYLPIKSEDGTYTYSTRTIDEKFLNEAASKLLRDIRQIKEMESKRVVIGIFYLNEPNKMFPGTFKYIGDTFNNEIKLKKIAYDYYLLNDDFVSKNDINSHKMFESITEELKKIDKGALISGEGIYFENKVKKIDIEINGNFIKSEVIYLSNIISDQISNEINLPVDIIITIKNNKQIEAVINKQSDSLVTNIEILRGWFYETNRKRSNESSRSC